MRGYDYTQAGAYFITLVTQDRMSLFGKIVDDHMMLNKLGHIVHGSWSAIPEHFRGVICDEFVVMPNHLHGMVVLTAQKIAASRPLAK